MTFAEIATLFGYMAVCSFTPGPGNILALNTTTQYGWKNSRRLIFGICVGYGVVQAICSIALCQLNNVLSPALQVLKYIGGIYMVWLAIHMIRSRPQTEGNEKQPTFREGFLLQFVNVKIYFYIMTLLSVYFIPHLHSAAGLTAAGTVAVLIGSAASLVWAFLGMKLQTTYEKRYRIINIILGLFLIYCAWNIIRG